MTGKRQGDPRKRKSKLRKAALLSAGLALAIVVDGPAAFGANNNKNNPTNHELYVEEVSVTFSTEDTSTAELGDCAAGSDRLTIHGVNFDNGAPPVVTFGKVESLTICSADDTTIVAELLNSEQFI